MWLEFECRKEFGNLDSSKAMKEIDDFSAQFMYRLENAVLFVNQIESAKIKKANFPKTTKKINECIKEDTNAFLRYVYIVNDNFSVNRIVSKLIDKETMGFIFFSYKREKKFCLGDFIYFLNGYRRNKIIKTLIKNNYIDLLAHYLDLSSQYYAYDETLAADIFSIGANTKGFVVNDEMVNCIKDKIKTKKKINKYLLAEILRLSKGENLRTIQDAIIERGGVCVSALLFSSKLREDYVLPAMKQFAKSDWYLPAKEAKNFNIGHIKKLGTKTRLGFIEEVMAFEDETENFFYITKVLLKASKEELDEIFFAATIDNAERVSEILNMIKSFKKLGSL